MKPNRSTLLSLLTIHCSFFISFAQFIPNSSFENWKFFPSTTYMVPDYWISNDILVQRFDAGYKGITVEKIERSHSGKYALKMQVAINHGDTVNGGIYSIGTLDSLLKVIYHTGISGFKFNSRPSTFTGFYIYKGIYKDSGVIGVMLTRWNFKRNTRDTLINATLKVGENTPDYLPFVIPMKYRISDEKPDTALIALGIEGPKGKPAHVGTTFIIDDLNFSIKTK
jgi:hypothetical protein